jgi:exonuclease SbcD
LAYSFSEHAHTKGSWLVELGPKGVQRVDAVDAPVPRRLAVLSGPLEKLLTDPALARHEDAWCQVTLTDDERPAEAMTRLRSRFPHTLELRFAPGSAPSAGTYTRRTAEQDDLGLCCGFVEHVRRRPPSAAERELLSAAVEGARVALAREGGVAPLRAGRRLASAPGLPAGFERAIRPARAAQRETGSEERVAG